LLLDSLRKWSLASHKFEACTMPWDLKVHTQIENKHFFEEKCQIIPIFIVSLMILSPFCWELMQQVHSKISGVIEITVANCYIYKWANAYIGS
jgi:hypothetical protein